MNNPINAAINSPHDDLLAVRIAKNLISGQALGEWNVNTFAKPPGFSFYLFLLNKINIEYIIINHSIYIFLSLLLSLKICEILFGKKGFNSYYLIIYTYLIFVPTVYQNAFSKVYRSTLTYLLVLLFTLLIMHMWTLISKKDKIISKNEQIRNWLFISFNSLFLGLVYAALALTRAESYWVIIALIVSLSFVYFFIKNKFQFLLISVTSAILSFATYGLVINSAQDFSEKLYGYRLTENFYGNNFSKAINLWSSVYVKNDDLYHVTINKSKRELVYSISPTAAKLKPFLETGPNIGWKIQSCQRINICDESSSWFPWELRDAAVQTGEIRNESDFQTFFSKIHNEISENCSEGTIECGRLGSGPGSRNILDLPKSRIFYSALNAFQNLFTYPSGGNIAASDSSPGLNEEIINEFHEVVNYKRKSESTIIEEPRYTSKILATQVQLYKYLNIGILFLTLFFLIRRPFLVKLGPILIFLISAIGINVLGLSVFEISLGFTPGLDLYLLPAYPIFHVVMAICLLAPLEYYNTKSNLKKRNLYE